MLNKRDELHNLLVKTLGSRNVYFQPPENLKMEYPAIVYSLSNINKKNADNKCYNFRNLYNVILIDKKPDSEVIQKLIEIPSCKFDRSYKAESLNHYVFTIYF